ncbi:MAG: hypothetical protein HYY05_02460 [Chloroflexi bacterium]|nr:hypothetical protein [Chloroflexota bacterium]
MTRTCAICGAEGRPGAVSCRKCGATLEGSAAAGPNAAGPAGRLLFGPYRHDAAGGGPLVAAEGLPSRNLPGLLKETFACLGRHYTAFSLLGLLSQGPSFLLLLGAITEEVSWVLYLLLAPVETLLGALIILATARDQAGEPVSFTEALGPLLRRLPALFGGWVVFLALLVVSALGLPLFIYLLVSLYFFQQPIVIEGAGPLAGLRRGHALVKGSWWRVFGIGLVLMLLLTILASVAGLFGRLPSLFAGALTTALGNIGATLLYLDLRVRKEGCTAERLAWELGGRVGASPEPAPRRRARLRPTPPWSPSGPKVSRRRPHEPRRRGWGPVAIALLFGGGLVAVAGAFGAVKLTTWQAELYNMHLAERREFDAVAAEAYAAYWTSPQLVASPAGAGQRYALLEADYMYKEADASALREFRAQFVPVPGTPGLAALQREGLVASIGMGRGQGFVNQSTFDVTVVRAVVPSGLPHDATRTGEIIARVVAGLEPPPEGDLLVVSLVEEVGRVECVVASLGVLGREEAARQAYESWYGARGGSCG